MLMREVPVTIIDIVWDGPFTLADVKGYNGNTDYGVYQIYGTRNSVADELLYIGKAESQTFGQRIPQHDWPNSEPKPVEIYLGRLGSVQPITDPAMDEEWGECIRHAEAALIYYTTPPFNGSGKNNPSLRPDIVVLNLQRHHRIPRVVSTLYDHAPFWDPAQNFKSFATRDEDEDEGQ
jgi:hypothetical protein